MKQKSIQTYFTTWILFASALLISPTASFAKTVQYSLTASKGQVNLSGKKTVDWALMLNNSIPAPTLEFTEGDDAEITVHNGLKDEEVSLHWHGILLPPEMDGVPYVNTPPIHPGASFTFKFRIRQHGTYWYHSHTNVQEQKGLYGAIVIHPKKPTIPVDQDVVVVLSDWSDENASQILANLRKDGDYYLYKKNSMRSWLGAIQARSFGAFIQNELTRMGGMDVSDVGYDAFLINGKRDVQLISGKPGQKVRLRIINASASTYFHVALGQELMRVIAADGVDIQPIMAKELLIGMAETYDVLYEIEPNKNVELKATAQDVTGYTSGWIGSGQKVFAPEKPALNLYETMDHGSHSGHDSKQQGGHDSHSGLPKDKGNPTHDAQGHGDHSQHADHADMDHHEHSDEHSDHDDSEDDLPSVDLLTVDQLQSPEKTVYSPSKQKLEFTLVLGGDMERYVWHINGRAIHEDRNIVINEGDVIRFTFVNETMMHHPMHLHGHFFRVLTGAGDFAPLKHTVDVPPHGTRTIEFLANEPGEWMLHCHNLYHMKSGMARVIKYMSYSPRPEIAAHQNHDPHAHEHVYFAGQTELASTHAALGLRLLRTWDSVELSAKNTGFKDADELEGDLFYRRWFNSYFSILAGATYFAPFEESKTRGAIGVAYTLPFLIETKALIDHKAKARLTLEKHFQWTASVFSDVEATFRQTEKPEFDLSIMYGPEWSYAVGLTVHDTKPGVAAKLRF